MSLEKKVKKAVKGLLYQEFPELSWQKIKRYDDFEDDLDLYKWDLEDLKKPIQKKFGLKVRKKELRKCEDVDDLIMLILRKFTERQQEAYLDAPIFLLFGMLSQLAITDAPIRQEEIQYRDNLLNEQLDISSETRTLVHSFWEQTVKEKQGFHFFLDRFVTTERPSAEESRTVMWWLFGMALADGPLHTSEGQLLQAAFSQLRPGGEYRQFKAELIPDYQEYYELLKCKETDDLATIKKAYRELAAEMHPDRFAAKELPQDMMDFAKERIQQINHAYEMIIQLRQHS